MEHDPHLIHSYYPINIHLLLSLLGRHSSFIMAH